MAKIPQGVKILGLFALFFTLGYLTDNINGDNGNIIDKTDYFAFGFYVFPFLYVIYKQLKNV